MIEVRGDAWKECVKYDALCITTNGAVKTNGECVMGRGIALEAKKRFPQLPGILGYMIKSYGNHVHKLGVLNNKVALLSFPVKHHWKDKADIELINRSAQELVQLANRAEWERILLPRPGCGNGKLSWSDVKLVLNKVLDDRFHIITW